MSKGSIQRIQDSVHGLMEFRGMETLVIDILRAPELQRLRRIRQLGLAHLVYPGAEHSRLSHCLGASWLAIRFGRQLAESSRAALIESLCPSDFSVRDLAIAALCHDLGHGPLSHAWEREVVGEKFDSAKWAQKLGMDEKQRSSLLGAKWHELIGSALLMWPEGQLHKLLERNETKASDRIRYMLAGRYYLSYLTALISADIDVDRADFLRRDTHQSGVAYGRYDLDWLISTCTIGRTEANELVVGFDSRKAVRVIEQFLIAREALYDTVYHHKTIRAAEGMVALFLRRVKDVLAEGVTIKATDLIAPYISAMRGEALDQQQILSLDDFSLSVLIDLLTNDGSADPTVRDLGQRILGRDLFKIVPANSQTVAEFISQPEGFEKIYAAIKPFCRGNPRYYLVIDRTSFSMFSKSKMGLSYLVDENGLATPIKEHPKLKQHDKESTAVRLFTVSEAVDAVRKLLD
jgi:uncharacterized protein